MRISVWLQVCRAVCVALLAVALMSGCGSTGAENAALAGKPLKVSHARLKIQRTDEIVSAGPAARVKLDGREVASLGVGASTMLDVPAGTHSIAVDQDISPRAFSITLKAKPGMLYTLEISPRSEPVVAGIMLGMIGYMVEAAVNENGGTFQIRVVEAKPARG